MFEISHGLSVPSLGFWASSEKISLNCCGLISLVCRKSFVGCSSIAALLPVCLWLISSSEILCKYYRKSKEAKPWYMSSFYQFYLVQVCPLTSGQVKSILIAFVLICMAGQIVDFCLNCFDILWKESFPHLTWKFNIRLIWSRKNMQFYINEQKTNPWISLHATIYYFSL